MISTQGDFFYCVMAKTITNLIQDSQSPNLGSNRTSPKYKSECYGSHRGKMADVNLATCHTSLAYTPQLPLHRKIKKNLKRWIAFIILLILISEVLWFTLLWDVKTTNNTIKDRDLNE